MGKESTRSFDGFSEDIYGMGFCEKVDKEPARTCLQGGVCKESVRSYERVSREPGKI